MSEAAGTRSAAPPPGGPADARRWWILYAIAAATFVPVLFFRYVGEEAILPISSLEMWYHGEWVRQLLYGSSLQRNPLPNWLIIPLSVLAGWEHVLVVTRIVMVGATLATGLVLAWLVRALFADPAFAAFAALAYVTLGDVFFYRGWLSYTDPLFGAFVFTAMACLWVACLRQSGALLAVAIAVLTCGFMTKALTAYAFYVVAATVLFLGSPAHRRFLLGRVSLLLHAVAAALPLAWLYFVPGNTGQGARLFAEITGKLVPDDLLAYAAKLAVYPAETALRLAPALFIVAWLAWRRGRPALEGRAATALWIALLNFAPYWLAPQSSVRYLMPIYPFAGLVIARILWQAGAPAVGTARAWIGAAIALKLLFVLVAFPWYQSTYRGENYRVVAREIMERTAGHPLYANNVSASGLSVTAEIDVMRLPQPPLVFPPPQWENGFVINYSEDPALGRVAGRYRLGGTDLYLLCRGAACERAGGGNGK